jgi:hypothetical protein
MMKPQISRIFTDRKMLQRTQRDKRKINKNIDEFSEAKIA